MTVLNYRTVLRKEPEGGYTVTVPSLPGCITYGATVDHKSLQAYGEETPRSW
jgi:predicted RNase H-like HicB family nuclease